MGGLLYAQLRGVKVTHLNDWSSNARGRGFTSRGGGVGSGVIQLIHKNGRHVGYVLPKNAEVGQRDRAQTHLSRYTRTGLGDRTAFGHFFRSASSSRSSTARARRGR